SKDRITLHESICTATHRTDIEHPIPTTNHCFLDRIVGESETGTKVIPVIFPWSTPEAIHAKLFVASLIQTEHTAAILSLVIVKRSIPPQSHVDSQLTIDANIILNKQRIDRSSGLEESGIDLEAHLCRHSQ